MTRAPLRARRNVRSFTSEKRSALHASAPYAWTTRAPANRLRQDAREVAHPFARRAREDAEALRDDDDRDARSRE